MCSSFQKRLHPNVLLSANLLPKSFLCSLYPGKHVRACIVYTWDHKSSQSFWAGMKVCVHKPTPLLFAHKQSLEPINTDDNALPL